MRNRFLKRITTGSIFIALVGLLITGCMGSDNDSVTYNRLGIVQIDGNQPYVRTSDDYFITYPQLEINDFLKEGSCLMVDFKGQLGLSGELTEVELIRSDTIPSWPLSDELIDTIAVYPGEGPIKISSIKNNMFFLNHFVLKTEHIFQQANQKEEFLLSYDPKRTQEMADTEKRVYELFLRAIRTAGGDTIARSYKSTNVFDLNSFVENAAKIEQSKGNDTILNFRIKYPSGPNSDTTAWKWTATDNFEIVLSPTK